MFHKNAAPRLPKVARRLNWKLIAWGLGVLLRANAELRAGSILVPNGSFESPATFFVSLNLDSWQRTPQPDGWNTNSSGDWTTLTGLFKNTAPGNSDHIDNCDGDQAMWLFATPEAGLFQDYDSMDWNDAVPTHAFDARFEVGRAYQLTVGVLVGGLASGGGISPGARVSLGVYYRDALSNRVTVAATTVTNSPTIFSNSTHFIDFSVSVPSVKTGDAWVDQHIGLLLLSTVSADLQGGYWDLDNVRLTSTLAATLQNAYLTNGQFHFMLSSEPGVAFELLSSTNLAAPMADWSRLVTLTNTTGTTPLVDTNPNFDQRFYRVRQLP